MQVLIRKVYARFKTFSNRLGKSNIRRQGRTVIIDSKIIDKDAERLSEKDNYNLKHRIYFIVNVCDSPNYYGKYIDYHFSIGAEEPLPENGACLLGSMNLASYVRNKFTKEAYFDFKSFKEDVKIATIALNDILDEGIPFHPLEAQKIMAREYRQIGLGLMGYGDMLIMLKLEYGKKDALCITEEIAIALLNASLQASSQLAKKDGVYPKYKKEAIMKSPFLLHGATKETLKMIDEYGLRNSQVLTSAPTGSLSTMWGITGGIEPIYQLSYTRKTETLNNGKDSFYKVFTSVAREYMELNNIKNESDLPSFFVTAMTLNWKDRINTQSIWQKYIDASISSTVNLPKETTVDEVKELYLYAWKKGLKGVTIFRDGCKRAGILGNHKTLINTDGLSAQQLQNLLNKQIMKELQDNPNICPKCGGKMLMMGGCSECEDCAYSPCGI